MNIVFLKVHGLFGTNVNDLTALHVVGDGVELRVNSADSGGRAAAALAARDLGQGNASVWASLTNLLHECLVSGTYTGRRLGLAVITATLDYDVAGFSGTIDLLIINHHALKFHGFETRVMGNFCKYWPIGNSI